MPLKQKILAIVLAGSYNKLLYQTLSESMSYSSGKIASSGSLE